MPASDMTTASGARALSTVDVLRQRITSMVMEGSPADYHNVMRILTKELVRQVHVRSRRLRLVLLLLVDILPQPRQEGDVSQAALLRGFDVFYDVLNTIDSLDYALDDDNEGFMDHDWAVDHGGPLPALSLDIMAFLESGQHAEAPTTPSFNHAIPEAMADCLTSDTNAPVARSLRHVRCLL